MRSTYAAPLDTMLHSLATSVKSTYWNQYAEQLSRVGELIRIYLSVVAPTNTRDEEFELLIVVQATHFNTKELTRGLEVLWLTCG